MKSNRANREPHIIHVCKAQWLMPDLFNGCGDPEQLIWDSLADILCGAVEESLLPGGEEARAWLNGESARDAFQELDICHDAAMASLRKQWDVDGMERQISLFDSVH